MKTLSYRHWPLLAIFILLLNQVYTQDDNSLLANLTQAEEEAINALVLYPEETRVAILEATLYPEVLIKIENIQSRIKTEFQVLLESFPQSTQELIWDLTRYPDLITKLVEKKQDPDLSWDRLFSDYPEVVHNRMEEAYEQYYTVLQSIQSLNEQADHAFAALLFPYPTTTQSALQHLLPLPEVLSILTDNIRLTVLAGALYRSEPERLLTQVDSLHLEAARQNAKELEDWKASLENDPKALQQLKASAEAFSTEYTYDDDFYEFGEDDVYYRERTRDRIAHEYYFYHYPYWFGYPNWYYYPRWRLYPYWYDWGFYFGPDQNIVIINLPSFHYTHWYFNYAQHHQRWAHLSTHFTRHSHAHPRIASSITTGISVWQQRNRNLVSRDWLVDDGNLTQRYREFGKFEAQRNKYNRSHPRAPLNQQQFIERNSKRYPEMTKKTVRSVQPRLQQPRQSTNRVFPQKKQDLNKRKKAENPRTSYRPQLNQGTERHRNLSERSKSTRPTTIQPKKPARPAPRSRTVKPRQNNKSGKAVPRKKKGG